MQMDLAFLMPQFVRSQMIDAVVIGLSFAIDIFTLFFEERYAAQVCCLLMLCRMLYTGTIEYMNRVRDYEYTNSF